MGNALFTQSGYDSAMQRLATVLLVLSAGLLSGCGASVPPAASALVIADAASVTVFHRDIVDFIVSGVTGQDCSVVHLDRGRPYCRQDFPATPPPYCTRTIGVANCWASPQLFANPPRGLADGPWALTPQQEANRTWPF
jgi:hypothetical protein